MFRNLYDGDVTVWSPQGRLHQVEYAMEAVKQGSATVGVKSNTHAVIVALKRASSKLSAHQKKIIPIDDHIGISIAGLTADARVLSRYMKTECLNNRYAHDTPLPVSRLITMLGNKMQVCTQRYDKRPFGVGLLVAGYDDQGPHIYQTCPSAAYFDCKAMAIGARSQSAKTYLEKHLSEFRDCGIDDLIRHALRSLRDTLPNEVELSTKNVSIGVVGKGIDFTIYDDEAVQPYLASIEGEERRVRRPLIPEVNMERMLREKELAEAYVLDQLTPKLNVMAYCFADPREENDCEEEEEEGDPIRVEEDNGALPRIYEIAIQEETVERSVTGLIGLLKTPQVFGFQYIVKPVYIEIDVIRVPEGDVKFVIFDLPNKPVSGNAKVCLIINDEERGLKVDHEEHVAGFKRIVDSAGLSGTVTEVLSVHQLKANYKQFEAKQKLLEQYDVFLVDQRIYFEISSSCFLSKFFYKMDKFPVPVRLNKPEIMKDFVEKALRTSLLPLRATETTLQMLVGNTSMSTSHIVDNVFFVARRLTSKFVGGFGNIRQISVRSVGLASTPMYVRPLTPDEVRPPVLESKVKQGTVVGDLSTLRGGEAVVVKAEGDVRVIPNPKYKPTPSDEEEFYQSEAEEPEEEEEESEDDDERPKKKSEKQKKTEKGKEPKKIVNQEKQRKKVEIAEVPAIVNNDESDSEVDMYEERNLNNRKRVQDEAQSEEEDARKEKHATKKSGKRRKQ